MKLSKSVKDFRLVPDMTVKELMEQMKQAWGFTAGKLSLGLDILDEMESERYCTKFLSFTGNLVATGSRGVLKDLAKYKLVDVIVTTCGTLDHDLARCTENYYKGSFVMNDTKLREEGISRLGNVLVPDGSYGVPIEKGIQHLLQELWNEGVREVTGSSFSREIGNRLCNQSSILFWAAKNDIPVFVPGITDGAVGYQMWLFSQDHDLKLNLLKDSGRLSDIVYEAKKSGALIVGGGISKHHTLWWNQFREGLDYAVYISTADEWDGSLSGARPREAVSWGKIGGKAKRIMIEGDASVILPLMCAALISRLKAKRLS